VRRNKVSAFSALLIVLGVVCAVCVDLSFAFVCCCARGEIYLSCGGCGCWSFGAMQRKMVSFAKATFRRLQLCRPVFSCHLPTCLKIVSLWSLIAKGGSLKFIRIIYVKL
jgi:hypothetical protein